MAKSVPVVSCLTVQLMRRAHLAIGGIATRLEELKYLFRPGIGSRAHGPAAVGITELSGVAGAAEGRHSANGTGPPRVSLVGAVPPGQRVPQS